MRELEAELAAFCGPAMRSPARAAPTRCCWCDGQGIGPGDAIICPSFTFYATAEIGRARRRDAGLRRRRGETASTSIRERQRAVAAARRHGLNPKAIVPVDLFGQPADHAAIAAIAGAENLFVLDDAAQALARPVARPHRHARHATATSFFPAKPLGCYGDGGAMLTDDDALAAEMRRLRVHGDGRADRHERALRHRAGGDPDREAESFSRTRSRRATASPRAIGGARRRRDRARVAEGMTSVWAQYTIRLARAGAIDSRPR